MPYHEYDKPHRLRHFNYSSATSYFVTFNTKDRKPILSEIHPNETGCTVTLSPVGELLDALIRQIPDHYPDTWVDSYVIMPDHVHLLLTFTKSEPATSLNGSKLSRIVHALKSLVTKKVGDSIWQLDFYDVVADTDRIYDRCYDYIRYNPIVWLTRGGAEPDEGDLTASDDPLPPE